MVKLFSRKPCPIYVVRRDSDYLSVFVQVFQIIRKKYVGPLKSNETVPRTEGFGMYCGSSLENLTDAPEIRSNSIFNTKGLGGGAGGLSGYS